MASARAATILVDFGSNTSFRGASAPSPDQNGNYWNSMQPGLYYTNLKDTTNAATSINFGFSTGVGTDSYNGPAGPTNNSPLSPAEIAACDIDQTALGILGVKEAAVDYAAEKNCRFEVQGLDPSKKYNLTFYGAHEFSADDATRYSVYSDNTYTSLVATGTLNIQAPGSPWLHNRDTTLTLGNLAPQASNILYVQFTGDSGVGDGFGYLNSMAISEVVPEPSGLAMCGVAALLAARRRRHP
jgi:hypothetical protein